MKKYKFFINNKWYLSKHFIDVINPFNLKTIAQVYIAGKKHIEKAIKSVEKAFLKTKEQNGFERAQILRRISKGIKRNREKLAKIIALEAGKPIRFAYGEVDRAVITFNLAAEEAENISKGEIITMEKSPASSGRFAFTQRFPVGPIFGIVPFNFPLNLAAHKIAPALAAGNTIIIKPSSKTPLTLLELAKILIKAKIVPGSVNILPCPDELAEEIVTDPRIKLLTFTGSAEVGWMLKRKAGKKKVVLELGGNAAAIVDKDVDIDKIIPRLALGSFAYSGQVCISIQRIYVHQKIFSQFVNKFIKEIKKNIKVGNIFNYKTIVGPMIDLAAAKRVESWLIEAKKQGAKIIFGGKRKKNFIFPTIVTNTNQKMKINGQEVFAPVVCLEKIKSIKEAVKLVNNSRYGLQASIFAKDINKVFYVYKHLDVGGVIINDYPTFRVDNMPYGGVKDSGFGREGIRYAIEEMTELKLAVISKTNYDN